MAFASRSVTLTSGCEGKPHDGMIGRHDWLEARQQAVLPDRDHLVGGCEVIGFMTSVYAAACALVVRGATRWERLNG